MIEPGIHFLETTLNDKKFIELEVPLEFARVHHYRDYYCESNCKSNNVSVVDTSMHKFIAILLNNVKRRLKIISQHYPVIASRSHQYSFSINGKNHQRKEINSMVLYPA